MNPLEQGAALLGGGRFHEALALFAQALRQDLADMPSWAHHSSFTIGSRFSVGKYAVVEEGGGADRL